MKLIKNSGTYSGSEGPRCPWCGQIDQDWFDWAPDYDDEDVEKECGFCDRRILVKIRHNVSFTTCQISSEKKKEDGEHD